MRWAKILGVGALLVAVGGTAYSNTFDVPFVYDDQSVIVARTPTRYATMDWRDAFTGRRTLTYFTHGLNYRLGGLNVGGYHAVNLALHLLNAGAVTWLAWLLARLSVPRTIIRWRSVRVSNHLLIATVAGLLFVSHPLQTEGVTYVRARAGQLAALGYVITLVFYCQWRKQKRWWYLGLALLSTYVALHTRETALTIPLAVGVLELLFFTRSWWHTSQRRWFLALLLIAVVGSTVYLWGGIALPTSVQPTYSHQVIAQQDFALTQQAVKVAYLGLFVLPVGQSLDHEFELIHTPFDPRFFAASAVLGAVLVLAWLVVKGQYRIVSFGILLWFIALIPESSLFPLPEMMVEYRLYLPMVGLALASGSIIGWLFTRMQFAVASGLVVVLILSLAALTYQRNELWRDPVLLWGNAAHQAKHKARPHVNKAVLLTQQGRFLAAEAELHVALAKEPQYQITHHNLGVVYLQQGRFAEAISYYHKAIALWPSNPLAHYDLGLIYEAEGNSQLARYHLTEAARLGVPFASAVMNESILEP